jgi:hypothetical protein
MKVYKDWENYTREALRYIFFTAYYRRVQGDDECLLEKAECRQKNVAKFNLKDSVQLAQNMVQRRAQLM